jgi:serine/threonine protein kinase
MAPEQATGETVDARSDLFAVGSILFEMLAGRPAFAGRTVARDLACHAYEQPGALTGLACRRGGGPRDPPIAGQAACGNVRRRPTRWPKNCALSATWTATTRPALVHALTRLVVLPIPRPPSDPETDFLAFSLPDAIADIVVGIPSLIVRSSADRGAF